MGYRVDPRIKARVRWNKVLDNGHHYALCMVGSDGAVGVILASARHRWEIERLGRFRPWLLVVNVDEMLANLS